MSDFQMQYIYMYFWFLDIPTKKCISFWNCYQARQIQCPRVSILHELCAQTFQLGGDSKQTKMVRDWKNSSELYET